MSAAALRPLARGNLRKMTAAGAAPVRYALPVGAAEIALNPLIGARVALRYLGSIHCVHCGRRTRKSFDQGHCYPCFRTLAACDRCVKSPEKCHYFQGTCREPQWGERHCMQPHVVYLANASGLEVGITRAGQIPLRWIDQGAVQALPFARTATRQQAGFVEVALKAHVSDRTAWQRMLRGDPEPEDLPAARARLSRACAEALAALRTRFGEDAIRLAEDPQAWRIEYPVARWPAKVRALDLERLGRIEGVLEGIKGQYWLLSSGVVNIRKYTAYEVELAAADAAAQTL